jgi:beta-phosphoglucomutase-like phosphatase (HAD superfamily)
MFGAIVTAEDVKNGKSKSPEPYLKGAELLRLAPSDIVAVEDNPVGVRSAKDAGCRVIAYPNGFTKDMDFTGVGADAFVSSLAEIDEAMLQRLFSDRR